MNDVTLLTNTKNRQNIVFGFNTAAYAKFGLGMHLSDFILDINSEY